MYCERVEFVIFLNEQLSGPTRNELGCELYSSCSKNANTCNMNHDIRS